jgi:hypothetical protein
MTNTEITPTLPTLDFSRAKSVLSDLMTRVVHEHRPSVVSRHRGKERIVLVRSDDLVRYLDAFSFELDVIDDGDEVTVAVPRLGVLGFGRTSDEAIDDLLAELRTYAADYFERASFYAATDRADHAPWLLRFALVPASEQRALLQTAPA